ncbi:uncharacterized protein LOC110869837 [Helianthus annuus]|uniref:uncharacterized protein LOC110869837 n=1 Tax=Helianthus annuus TaxID=4232 RepID=UPI000B8EF15E|nr:uncharacterized protein LOC110869837 [Helianthus annuus]
MGTEECVLNLDDMVIVHRNVSPCPRFDQSEDENAFFIDAFLELPGGASERKATASRNQSSLLAHAESLTPSYLHEEDVNVLRWFISQVEKPPMVQESASHRVMEVHNTTLPINGNLNVATKLPDLSSKPDMGPKMDIAYGDSVTKLHYEKSDTVNVQSLTRKKKVKEKHGDAMEGIRCHYIHKA